MQIAHRIRRMAAPHWLGVFGLIIAGWAALYAMALPPGLIRAGQVLGADFWRSLCVVSPDGAGYRGLALMWVLMSAAMMAPTFLPSLATFDDFVARGRASRGDFAKLLGGYLVVWLGFALLAAGAQLWLYRAGLLSPIGQSLSPWFTGFVLIGVVGYQFSPLKDACLTQCREPLSFYLHYWREGPWNGAQLGLRLGAICLGCCWALMGLAFVGGVMNLAFMGLATVVMIFEKLPEIGRYVTRPLGVILIAGGAMSLAQAVAGLF